MGKRVGVLGSGQVAQVLAAGFQKHGYEVKIGSRDPKKLAGFATQQGIFSGTLADTAAFGELLVLAVKGDRALEVLKQAGASHLAGKVVIDVTNPISAEPPQRQTGTPPAAIINSLGVYSHIMPTIFLPSSLAAVAYS